MRPTGLKVYCRGDLVSVRYLLGGWALCNGCGARLRVVW